MNKYTNEYIDEYMNGYDYYSTGSIHGTRPRWGQPGYHRWLQGYNDAKRHNKGLPGKKFSDTAPIWDNWLIKTILVGGGAMVIAIGELNASIAAIFAAILVIGVNLGLHFLDLKIESSSDPKYHAYKNVLFIVYFLIIVYFVKALFGRYF